MLTPRQEIELRVAAAANRLWTTLPAGPFVRPCLDARHGDFQSNLAMVLSKEKKANPRDLAAALIKELAIDDISLTPEIAGAGFVNFRLKPDYVAKQVEGRAHDARLGIDPVAKPITVVVDFSSPNIAKEMHVGHLRSTVLGDSLARINRFLGHRVITDNHLGDWGTGFGIVLYGYKREGDPAQLEHEPFRHLEDIYKRVAEESKHDPAIREAAKAELVKLQQGDPENLALWKKFIDMSIAELSRMYLRLGVTFDYWLGESSYNNELAGVVEDLKKRGIARESEGAIAIFSEGKLDPKDDPFKVKKKDGLVHDAPFIIQKSDEGFNYSTTDLATLQHRKNVFKADRVLYVVDGRQQQHFQQLFTVAQRWGLGEMALEHIWFGTILGPDKKPIKTRGGENIKLKQLLNEAEERAGAIITEKDPDLTAEEKTELGRIVGLGALKYADLAQNRNLDYVFDWDKLLAFDGNTAPYIQNAYVRTRAMYRKAGLDAIPQAAVILKEPAELELGKKLIDMADSIEMAGQECRPHLICQYLYDLAALLHRFWEHCPVLKEGVDESTRNSRLVLVGMTGQALKLGLGLLGIETMERM